mmetsp:Transcript_503/g.1096  ORF Transcript_503/g.1096 Transcript_503/m.1096 type:complete len:378 (+) Transcript_503:185-1318(+)
MTLIEKSRTFREIYDFAGKLPKIELHLHLDGSLPVEFICRRAAERGINCPPVNQLRRFLQEWKLQAPKEDPDQKEGPGENWRIFDFCNQVLQTREELQEATRLVALDRAKANVVHCEVRFCPELHTHEGLSPEEVVEAVCAGFEQAVAEADIDLTGGIIICALRNLTAAHSMRMADLARRYLWKGVIGFDIAGSEGAHPLQLHRDAIVHAKQNGVPVTVHAGEWIRGTIPNIQLALELGVERIGHGVALVQCPETVRRAAEAGLVVECCLTGNIRPWLPGAPTCYKEYPIAEMIAAGVKCALSSDNILLSGTMELEAESTNELARLVHDVGFTWDEAKNVLITAAEAVFMQPEQKRIFLARYRKSLEDAMADLTRLE